MRDQACEGATMEWAMASLAALLGAGLVATSLQARYLRRRPGTGRSTGPVFEGGLFVQS